MMESVISVVFLFLIRAATAEFPASNHKLVWNGPKTKSLDHSLLSDLEEGDFFYLITGDTQYFFPCTTDNTGCRASTPDCKEPLSDKCIERQSKWSNRYQLASLRAMVEQLLASTGRLPKGLVINGDLTQMGEEEQLELYQRNWEQFDQRFPTYPGLGNHDYFNNIDKCENNYCVHRMLSYFSNFVTNRLGRKMDMKNVTASGRVVEGSFAYSWDECSSNDNSTTCFHFTQENNYPTYTRRVVSNVTTWEIVPSLTWLENDLKQQAGVPTILNFHDFDTQFSEKAKRDYRKVIENTKADVIAVFFAHIHEKVGLRSTWCLDNGRRPVWFIYSGSIPANNYVLAHLSPTRKTLKKVYKVHVANESTSIIELETLKATCNSAG